MNYSLHAQRQLTEREISEGEVEEVVSHPDEEVEVPDSDRKILQKVIERGGHKFLYRVILAKERQTVITVYRTTKIRKYLKGGKLL